MKIRRMLTEILLEVTNQEIDVAVRETIEEEKSESRLVRPSLLPVNIFCVQNTYLYCSI